MSIPDFSLPNLIIIGDTLLSPCRDNFTSVSPLCGPSGENRSLKRGGYDFFSS